MHVHTRMHIHTRSAKDFRNRELFEKVFPELKARREQQERFMRYVYTDTHRHIHAYNVHCKVSTYK